MREEDDKRDVPGSCSDHDVTQDDASNLGLLVTEVILQNADVIAHFIHIIQIQLAGKNQGSFKVRNSL